MLPVLTYPVIVFEKQIEIFRDATEHDAMDVDGSVAEDDREIGMPRVVEVRFVKLTPRDSERARGCCCWPRWLVAGGLGDPLVRSRQSERSRIRRPDGLCALCRQGYVAPHHNSVRVLSHVQLPGHSKQVR